MPGPDRASWTTGAPKWAAVLVLTAASTTAIGWSLGRNSDPWRSSPRTPVPLAPTPASASAAPAPTPLAPTSAPSSQPPPSLPAAESLQPQSLAPHSTPQPAADPAPLRKLININTASQGELELLPGIGPALAKRILDHRTTKGPFKRIDDLDAVKGIGPKILARLRPQITVD